MLLISCKEMFPLVLKFTGWNLMLHKWLLSPRLEQLQSFFSLHAFNLLKPSGFLQYSCFYIPVCTCFHAVLGLIIFFLSSYKELLLWQCYLYYSSPLHLHIRNTICRAIFCRTMTFNIKFRSHKICLKMKVFQSVIVQKLWPFPSHFFEVKPSDNLSMRVQRLETHEMTLCCATFVISSAQTHTKLEWLEKLLPVWCWNLNEFYCTVNDACVTHEDTKRKLSWFNMLFACWFIQWENILKMRVHMIHCGLFHLWMSPWVTVQIISAGQAALVLRYWQECNTFWLLQNGCFILIHWL